MCVEMAIVTKSRSGSVLRLTRRYQLVRLVVVLVHSHQGLYEHRGVKMGLQARERLGAVVRTVVV